MPKDRNFPPESLDDVYKQLNDGVPLRYVPHEMLRDELPENWSGETVTDAILMLGRYVVPNLICYDVSGEIGASRLLEEQDPDLPCVFNVRMP